MLEIAKLRHASEDLIERLEKRGIQARRLVQDALELDRQRRENQAELDQIQARANAINKEIGQLFKRGQREAAEAKKEESTQLKTRSKELQQTQDQLAQALQNVLLELPNAPHPSVPAGHSEEDNEEIRRAGSFPDLGADARPHWELAQEYQLMDFDLGVKLAGAGFPVYTGAGAQLQRALVNFFLQENTRAGYREYQPPLLVNADSAYGTGQLPDKEGQMYHVQQDELYAIPTSEVPLTNIFRDQMLAEADLPQRLTAYTPCFRREAGSYGKEVRGLNRLHQFDKVELVQVVKPDESYQVLDQMVAQVEALLQKLELPYRILRLCGGDLGFTAALTYDFEVWSAGQQRWLEVSSVSNFETFQAQRMKIRYKTADKQKELVHTLNGSALALPRIVAALLENGQSPEGIQLPAALHPFLPFKTITRS
jgi:seryl-tRNA synthetase